MHQRWQDGWQNIFEQSYLLFIGDYVPTLRISHQRKTSTRAHTQSQGGRTGGWGLAKGEKGKKKIPTVIKRKEKKLQQLIALANICPLPTHSFFQVHPINRQDELMISHSHNCELRITTQQVKGHHVCSTQDLCFDTRTGHLPECPACEKGCWWTIGTYFNFENLYWNS